MTMKRFFLVFSVATVAACAPASDPTPAPAPSGTVDQTFSPDQPWPIRTREHVDLWLHGFALLQDDTALVPLFRRGYREELIVARNAANVTTLLDTHREELRAGFVRNPSLFNAQFIAMYFASASDLQLAIDYFFRAGGSPQAAQSREVAQIISILAGYFPSAADREWLRLFWQAISDESAKFYRRYWLAEQQNRTLTLVAIDSTWQQAYRPRLQNYIRATQQARGSLLLSLPIGGEGRTINLPATGTLVAVTYPERRENAVEVVYVAAHELAIPVAQSALTDNLPPAQRREGLAARYESAAAVRAGAILLQRAIPELADGYARYYLTTANQPIGSNVQASLAAAFPLPETIRAAINSQLDVVLGGI
jgi:hypothetical protein